MKHTSELCAYQLAIFLNCPSFLSQMLVDVHCHLTHEHFKDKLDEVLRRAENAGVRAIVCSGVNHPTNEEVLALAKKYPIIKASLGLYPLDVLGEIPAEAADETGLTRQTVPINLEEEFKFILKNKAKIVSLGECGMDFQWDKVHHQKQKENFEKIIAFAEKLNKPLIVHSRKAELECVEMLESSKLKKIIMHCFSGRKHLIKRVAEKGMFFSIPSNILRLQHFQMLTDLVDINQLLTETDAPWLSPYLEQKNEPAFVIESVKKIAEIKKIAFKEAEEQVWKNYLNVFERG